MKRYDSYKDSGVEWIGEIPSHWEVVRLKMLLKEHLMYGANEAAESDNKDFPRYIRITDIDDNGNLKDETFKSLEPEKAKDYLLTKGDVLFARSGATVGKTYLFKEDYKACFAGYLIKASCNSNLCPSFLLRFTQSGLYNNWKNSIFIQSTIQNIGADKYNELLLTLPSFKEQEVIVNYLDVKCSKIDNVIATQEKRVELLRELKQSIITRAVTCGINPDVKMKDSGVEWIGEIPEHWEVKRIKHVADIFGRIGFRGYNQSDLVLEGEGAITLSPSNMRETMNYTSCSYLSWNKYYESPEIMINNGDVLFVKTGSTYGKSTLVENLPLEATINPQIVVFKNFKCNNEFFQFYLRTPAIKTQVDNTVIGSTIPTIGQEKIKNYLISVPPIHEQDEIVEHVRNKTIHIDSSIEKALRQIELLKEYKQSLITEVVTGKRKVC